MKSQKTDARSIADIYNGLLNESHMQEAPPVIAVEVEPEPEGGCEAAAAGCECAGCEECEPTHERDDSEMHMAKAELNKEQEHSVHNTGHEDVNVHPAEDNQ